EQKKDIEYAFEIYKAQVMLDYGDDNHIRWNLEEKKIFKSGAEEVLNNLDKYFPNIGKGLGVVMVKNMVLKEENTRLRSVLKQIAEDKKEEYLNATDAV